MQNEAVNILNEHARDQYFSGRKLHIMFKRKTPKCPKCGKQSDKWRGMKNAVCDRCGAEVEHIAEVKPTEILRMQSGDNLLVYWNEQHQKRSCIIGNLMWFSIDEDEYFIVR